MISTEVEKIIQMYLEEPTLLTLLRTNNFPSIIELISPLPERSML